MEHTYEELKKKTVAELRKIASGVEHEAVQGYTQLNKEHLMKALCGALGIDMHEHHIVMDENKSKIKAEIKSLKVKREEALTAKNHKEYKTILRNIHHLKRALRKEMV